MSAIFKSLAADDSGATSLEYGLIAAMMALAILAIFPLFGPQLKSAFQGIADHFDAPADITSG